MAVVGAAKGDIAAGWWQGGSTPARVGGHASGGGQSGSGEVDDGEGISGGAASGEGADGEQTAAASPSFHWVKPWQRWARGAARCSVVCGGGVYAAAVVLQFQLPSAKSRNVAQHARTE